MHDIKALYLIPLFKYLRISRKEAYTNWKCSLIFHHYEQRLIRKRFCGEINSSNFSKAKNCYSAVEKRPNTILLKKLNERVKYLNYFHLIRTKLNRIIDIFQFIRIPPVIKKKRNEIVIIENSKLNMTGGENRCPDCSKEQKIQEIKEKISINLKHTVLSIRKLLVQGFLEQKKKKEEKINWKENSLRSLSMHILSPLPEACPLSGAYKPHIKPRFKSYNTLQRNMTLMSDSKTAEIVELKPKDLPEQLPKHELDYYVKTIMKTNFTDSSPKEEKPIFTSSDLPHGTQQDNLEKHNDTGTENNEPRMLSDIKSLENPVSQKTSKYKILKTAENYLECRDKKNRQNYKKEMGAKIPSTLEGLSYSKIDLSSSPTVTIIPIVKANDKEKKRDLLIKVENIPDNVDVIKIRSILSQLNLYPREAKLNSNYFRKNQLRSELYRKQLETERKPRVQNNNTRQNMTCPNKFYKPSPAKILFSKPFKQSKNENSRITICQRIQHKNDCRSYNKNISFNDY